MTCRFPLFLNTCFPLAEQSITYLPAEKIGYNQKFTTKYSAKILFRWKELYPSSGLRAPNRNFIKLAPFFDRKITQAIQQIRKMITHPHEIKRAKCHKIARIGHILFNRLVQNS